MKETLRSKKSYLNPKIYNKSLEFIKKVNKFTKGFKGELGVTEYGTVILDWTTNNDNIHEGHRNLISLEIEEGCINYCIVEDNLTVEEGKLENNTSSIIINKLKKISKL